jgi:voltage-gated potassium channel
MTISAKPGETGEGLHQWRGRWRRLVYETIEPGVKNSLYSRSFKRLCFAAILLSVLFAVVSTVPSLSAATRERLIDAEYLLGVFFLVEYGSRLWTAIEHPLYVSAGPWRSALIYAATPLMVLDALGLAPLVLQLAAPDARAAILLFQVLRFFRLARYSPALATVGRVLANEWRALMATGMIGLGMLLVAATAMYLLEHAAQPGRFASIPDAMYWAIVTLATVGYGDVVPVTPMGKVAAGAAIVAGLIFFALPIAIIATSFIAEMRRRDFIINYGMVARVPLFSTLDAVAISELAGMLKARKVPRDAIILRKGERGESMFFIGQGEVEVIVPDGTVRLREGDFFGEIAVLGRTRRTATVIARQPCELLVLDAADVLKVMEQNPQVETALRDAIATRQATHKQE